MDRHAVSAGRRDAFAKDCRQGVGIGKGGDGSKGYVEDKSKTIKGTVKKKLSNGGPKGGRIELIGGTKGSSGRAVGRPESEEDDEVGGVCIVGNVEVLQEEEEDTGRPGCRPKYSAHEDQRDEQCKIREGRRDGFSKIR